MLKKEPVLCCLYTIQTFSSFGFTFQLAKAPTLGFLKTSQIQIPSNVLFGPFLWAGERCLCVGHTTHLTFHNETLRNCHIRPICLCNHHSLTTSQRHKGKNLFLVDLRAKNVTISLMCHLVDPASSISSSQRFSHASRSPLGRSSETCKWLIKSVTVPVFHHENEREKESTV